MWADLLRASARAQIPRLCKRGLPFTFSTPSVGQQAVPHEAAPPCPLAAGPVSPPSWSGKPVSCRPPSSSAERCGFPFAAALGRPAEILRAAAFRRRSAGLNSGRPLNRSTLTNQTGPFLERESLRSEAASFLKAASRGKEALSPPGARRADGTAAAGERRRKGQARSF